MGACLPGWSVVGTSVVWGVLVGAAGGWPSPSPEGPRVRSVLEALCREASPARRAEAVASLRTLPVSAYPSLLEASHHVSPGGELYAWEILATSAGARDLASRDRSWVLEEAAFALRAEDPLVRNAAAEALAALGDPRGVDALLNGLDDRVFPRLDAWRRLRRVTGIERGFAPHAGSRPRARRREALAKQWERVRGRFGQAGFAWPLDATDEAPAAPDDRQPRSRPAIDDAGGSDSRARREVWGRASRLAGEGRLEEALALYDALSRTAPADVRIEDVRIEIERALTLHNLGRDAAALAVLEDPAVLAASGLARGRTPSSPAAARLASRLRNEQGLVLLALDRIPEALERFEAAARLDPTNPAPRVNRGFVMEAWGRDREAAGAFEAGARRMPLGDREAPAFFATLAAERARGDPAPR